jgi:hypothetical protein
MILSDAELDSLLKVQHRNPHQLLGMHPLGDGSGLVVRTFFPTRRRWSWFRCTRKRSRASNWSACTRAASSRA